MAYVDKELNRNYVTTPFISNIILRAKEYLKQDFLSIFPDRRERERQLLP